MKKQISLILPALLSLTALAEEGGAGRYLPGASASFIDALPGHPSLSVIDFFTYYSGSAGANRTVPVAGLATLGLDGTAYANSLGAVYETPLKLLGGNYAAGLIIPYVWVEAEAQVTTAFGSVRKRDTANGIGDITLLPFMLGWTNGPDLKYDLRFSVYAPSGHYDVGHLANVGKNYWTFEPGASVSWLSSKIGLEVSSFAGFNFNTVNNATDYQTGTGFHIDLTVAQHLPLLGGFVGMGANTFFYQQITGDSGTGATHGDFKGRTVGIGPVVSYATKFCGKNDLVAELKWLPELDVNRRLKGDYVWLKLALAF